MPRPSAYKEEIGDQICEHLAKGGSLLSFCEMEGHPDTTTVYRWLERHPTFGPKYARARELQAGHLAENCLRIADESTAETWQRDRLRIDTVKWFAGKVAPKKWGDRTAVDANLTIRDASGLSDAELEAIVSKGKGEAK